MSTTPVETWAVDLKEVTLIYPGVGWEWALVLVAAVLWLGWHVWQCRHESHAYRLEMARNASPAALRRSTEPD